MELTSTDIMALTPNSWRRYRNTKDTWNKTHFALYSAFARLFVSLSWCTCMGPYMPGAALSGLWGLRLEPPVAPEWSVDTHILNLMQRRSIDRCMSPLHLCPQQQMHLEQGPGMSTFLQFTWILVPTACYSSATSSWVKTAGVCGFSATKCTFVMRSDV